MNLILIDPGSAACCLVRYDTGDWHLSIPPRRRAYPKEQNISTGRQGLLARCSGIVAMILSNSCQPLTDPLWRIIPEFIPRKFCGICG